ncbi:beta-ketoacyl-[acyl-carrier-protein] synthase II [Hypericibacter terrae]|uniref:Beta-ketoacyl-[acyl-carrier-protein] synthase II n=1 Tax=Hypericibacter terrae TaxID=2602015 RepID=A0A5J6MH96_9PROT|nr:beta-ketoacyl-[acyl-carrier-protein] synthase family protein [Hypericibacter terrae]QEX16497.1 beta-ketoacyl-[acyl-carrier-protein] synthase II [Hypericibacter terrae]
MNSELFVTDCGVITPLGRGKQAVAQGLFAGSQRGIVARADFLPARTVEVGAIQESLAPLPSALAPYDSRNNRLMQAALAEIAVAVEDATSRYGRDRIAVILGTSTSGIADGEEALMHYRREGRWPEHFDYRMQETGSLAEFAARSLGLTGPAYTIATACSSSAKVFASARRLIRAGLADAAVVGGADTLCRMTLNGFASLEALSKGRCNPFSANRDGITIGEGAAAFLLDREPGPVRLLGVGETSDAHHATAPDPAGRGAAQAMRDALADAELAPETIAYINLHGTATPLNDAMEAKAIADLFGSRVPCSSTKALTGHMLGAAGGCEAAFLWLTLNPRTNPERLLPPHLWDGVPDAALPVLDLVGGGTTFPLSPQTAMLSNSFGFGGSNMALILGSGR